MVGLLCLRGQIIGHIAPLLLCPGSIFVYTLTIGACCFMIFRWSSVEFV